MLFALIGIVACAGSADDTADSPRAGWDPDDIALGGGSATGTLGEAVRNGIAAAHADWEPDARLAWVGCGNALYDTGLLGPYATCGVYLASESNPDEHAMWGADLASGVDWSLTVPVDYSSSRAEYPLPDGWLADTDVMATNVTTPETAAEGYLQFYVGPAGALDELAASLLWGISACAPDGEDAVHQAFLEGLPESYGASAAVAVSYTADPARDATTMMCDFRLHGGATGDELVDLHVETPRE